MTGRKYPALADRIAKAESLPEIDALLQEGRSYEFASRRSENKWRKAAKKRRAELNGASK